MVSHRDFEEAMEEQENIISTLERSRAALALKLRDANKRIAELEAKRSIVDIYGDIKDHFAEYPNHGINCSDMDEYIREVRRALGGYLSHEAYDATTNAEHRAFEAVMYVFKSASERR